jgi:DNA-directed RNA polymerase subunit RPC12/RpoP
VSEKVFDELTCPECGGQIGAVGDLPAGVKPCTCFASKKSARRPLPDEPDPLDMTPLANGGASAGASAGVHAKKICRICGKDLSGRSRLKDDKGYICKECSDAEFEAEAEAEKDCIKCPECERKLKPLAFVEYRGTLICKRCHSHHLDTDKLKVAKVQTTLHKAEERSHVMRWAIIAGVLALILIIKTLVQGW